MKNNTLKIDLDLDTIKECQDLLVERLRFLNSTRILEFNKIKDIYLIKKSKYSCKIELKKEIKDSESIIILQMILGDDWKRTSITFRDYKLGLRNWNRLFDIKRYIGGEYISGEVFNIFGNVQEEIKRSEELKRKNL